MTKRGAPLENRDFFKDVLSIRDCEIGRSMNFVFVWRFCVKLFFRVFVGDWRSIQVSKPRIYPFCSVMLHLMCVC